MTKSVKDLEKLHTLATKLMRRGALHKAKKTLEKSLQINPQFAVAWANLAHYYKSNQQVRSALYCLVRAIRCRPKNLKLIDHFFRIAKAEQCYRLIIHMIYYCQSHGLNPFYAHYLRALIYDHQERLPQAYAEFKAALQSKPNHTETLFRYAVSLSSGGHYDQAIPRLVQAVKQRPKHYKAWLNLALNQLRLGNYYAGLRNMETRILGYPCIDRKRYKGKRFLTSKILQSLPKYSTLFIIREQGAGDHIQMLRYAKLLKQQHPTCKIIIECKPELMTLTQVQPYVDQVQSQYKETLPKFDYCIPAMSLPLLFDTRLETIPNDVPYISVIPASSLVIPAKVGIQNSKTIKIGITWAGSPTHTHDHNRSIPLSDWQPIIDAAPEHVQFYSLQMGEAAQQLQDVPFKHKIIDLSTKINDFSDTAALIANLDLVISVDTAVAHLAGALNIPCWVMIVLFSDWRWLLDRTDTPWYPSLSLFRQLELHNWQPVIQKVAQALTLKHP